METKYYIPLGQLCKYYQVEVSFFDELDDVGLIEIATIGEAPSLHEDAINRVEKMIRLHRELDVNAEGIDVIFNLMDKVKMLQEQLNALQERLKLYE